MSPRTVAGLYLAPLPLLVLVAAVPVVRRSEGLQARALLLPGDDEVTVEPSSGLADRGRLLVWLVARSWLGVLVGQLTALAVAVAWAARGRVAAVPAAALVVGVLLVWAYLLAGVGELTAAVARRLLHPSAAELLAAQQARTERLLERTRLAAELHDSIGHALTVTLLQASAAREVGTRDPAFVDGALAAIEDSARAAAADLERVLALLRSGPAPAQAPTLGQVDRLVRSAEAAGARVDAVVRGPVADLSPVVSREAYRIVQEALTNALRHAGPVPVRLHVDVDGREPAIAVENPTPAAAVTSSGSGSGVRGLHEGVAALGGSAEAGPLGDVWRVEVRLPLGVGRDRPGAAGRRRGAGPRRPADDPRRPRRPRGRRGGRHGAVVVPLVARLRPDVVVMDIRMPLVDGIAATRELHRRLDHPPRVLVLTTFGDDENVYAALHAGADGVLPKRTPPAEIADAVRVVARGESLLFPAAIRALAGRHATGASRRPPPDLTPREADILRLMARGRSNAEIAGDLYLGLQTVKTHVSSLLRKLGARDRTQAVIAAYESGLVPLR